MCQLFTTDKFHKTNVKPPPGSPAHSQASKESDRERPKYRTLRHFGSPLDDEVEDTGQAPNGSVAFVLFRLAFLFGPLKSPSSKDL